jgi:hypothetical protein
MGGIPASGDLAHIAAGDGGVWILDKAAGTATPIDPQTDTPLDPIRIGPSPSGIAVGLGRGSPACRTAGTTCSKDLARNTPPPSERTE